MDDLTDSWLDHFLLFIGFGTVVDKSMKQLNRVNIRVRVSFRVSIRLSAI